MTLDMTEVMRAALDEAVLAAQAGEVPVGCVIVHNGEIIARGRNRREEKQSALSHAETEAIAEACARLGRWRLADCSLYVTLEPCPMCAGAILNARIPEIVFGAHDPALGACGGAFDLFYEDVGMRPRVTGGVLETECAAVLQSFFAALRTDAQA